MPASVITTNTETSTQGPKLKRGSVRVYASTAVYWVVGENPTAQKQSCALLPANTSIELRIPVNCSRLAVIAAHEPGYVTVTDVPGAKASCV